MVQKIEVWKDSEGDTHQNELSALEREFTLACQSYYEYVTELTTEVKAAIDALHEYAHREDAVPDRQALSHGDAIFRHCGREPGDDWAKRVERLNLLIDRLTAPRTLPIPEDGVTPTVGASYRLRDCCASSRIVAAHSDGTFEDSDGDRYDSRGRHIGGVGGEPCSDLDLVRRV